MTQQLTCEREEQEGDGADEFAQHSDNMATDISRQATQERAYGFSGLTGAVGIHVDKGAQQSVLRDRRVGNE